MKVIFLLDNNEYVEVAPEKLQIRQLSPGASALGLEVTIPVKGEDGKPQTNEDGTQKNQTGFRPFINYAVNLSVPTPAEITPPVQVPEAPVAAASAVKPKSKVKVKAAKRRSN